MLLLLEPSIRVNELVGIDLADVRLKEGSIYLKNAKTYRERVVPIQKCGLNFIQEFANKNVLSVM